MTTFRYVVHDRVPDYLRCGWLALPALEGTHHGYYSVLMAWHCDCSPVEPSAPGHTDLMVAPEGLDAWLEQNPLPEDTSEMTSPIRAGEPSNNS